MFFAPGEFPVCARLEKRLAALVDWPLENGEGLQVLRYRPGAEYRPHYDYFDPAEAGTPKILKRGGQRVASIVCYLNTPEGGGATVFPDIGLEVAPVRGNAVFFSYDRPHPSTRTLHGGAEVTAGEKWVATKWLREGRFE
jgi:prolyl 4-hydroxylase